MEETYVIDDPVTTMTASPLVGGFGKLARYQARSIQNTAMTVLDMQCEQVAVSQAIASHSRITGMTRQAAELYPEAAERFNALAMQHYWHLAEILEDRRRR